MCDPSPKIPNVWDFDRDHPPHAHGAALLSGTHPSMALKVKTAFLAPGAAPKIIGAGVQFPGPIAIIQEKPCSAR